MEPPTSTHSHLAGAYLALADDPGPAAPGRSVPRALCALAAGVALALAAPLAWASSTAGKPLDQPAATVAKSALSPDDDDEPEGDGA
jgi:hypothetical protein